MAHPGHHAAPDIAADANLAATLIEYCRGALASYKVPRSSDFDPALPREPTGKIRTQSIRDRYR